MPTCRDQSATGWIISVPITLQQIEHASDSARVSSGSLKSKPQRGVNPRPEMRPGNVALASISVESICSSGYCTARDTGQANSTFP
jgi:hypothetical protein